MIIPKEKLFIIPEKDYGDNYKVHLLEQYKLYVEMADRISSRRQTANSFFLTINTALITVTGYVSFNEAKSCPLAIFLFVGTCGMILCYMWYRLVLSYKGLNTGKYAVIGEIEKRLPVSPYAAEWIALGEGRDSKLYLPFTHIEVTIPWIFFSFYAFIITLNIPWSKIGSFFFTLVKHS